MTVQELLSDPAHWCQNAGGMGKNGRIAEWSNPDNDRWCLWGAIHKVYGASGRPFEDAYSKVTEAVGNPVVWNDDPSRTHQDVLQLVKSLGI